MTIKQVPMGFLNDVGQAIQDEQFVMIPEPGAPWPAAVNLIGLVSKLSRFQQGGVKYYRDGAMDAMLVQIMVPRETFEAFGGSDVRYYAADVVANEVREALLAEWALEDNEGDKGSGR